MNVYYCSRCGYRTTQEAGLKRSTGCCGSSGFLCPRCPTNSVMRVVANAPNATAQPGQDATTSQKPGQGRFQRAVPVRKKT